MPKDTNGVEIKVGDMVMRVHSSNLWNADDGIDFYFRVGDMLEVAEVGENGFVRVKGHKEGWNSPGYLEVIPQQRTFNPQIGDTIVTKERGNFICANYEEYAEREREGLICGVREHGTTFMSWNKYGKSLEDEYSIAEIIPAQKPEIKITAEISQESKIKILELENAMLRMLLRKEGVDV